QALKEQGGREEEEVEGERRGTKSWTGTHRFLWYGHPSVLAPRFGCLFFRFPNRSTAVEGVDA
ncbi:hypothetical protein ACJX0J_015785, partial [Zea mays]